MTKATTDQSTTEVAVTEHEVIPVVSADIANLKGASFEAKMSALITVTSFVGAPSENIDDYIGQRLLLKGAIVHKATVANKNITDFDAPEYNEADRIVMKVKTDKGLEKSISFMSMAITGWFKSFIFPLFGQGDYDVEIPIIVRQTKTPKGRSYTAQVVK